MPHTAIAILNYNGIELLKKYLPVVAKHHSQKDLYIIDNNSADESIAWVQKNYPEINIIKNPENYGFAKGYNEGLKHIQADYYVIMNNDVRTTPQWLNPIIDFMEKNKEISACMPKLLDDKNPDTFEYAGACGGYLDVLGYPFCKGRIFLSLEKDNQQYDEIDEIFWATGACMVVKSKVFWELGGFDEDFFAHMEEIDLCWRMKNIGYKIYVFPKSTVYHLGGGTLQKISPQKTYLNFRNSLITLLKNHPSKNLLIKVLFRLILDGIAGIKFLLEGHGKHTISVIRAHFYFYKNIKKFWKKRKYFEKNHKLSYTFSPVFPKSIVVHHYLFGKKKFKDISIK